MEWLGIIGGVIPVLVIGYVLWRLKRASGGLDATLADVEQSLADQGFEMVERKSGSMMSSSLQMVRLGDPQIELFIGHTAVHRDRPDEKLLGRSDNRFIGLWWLHVTATVWRGRTFPTLAMRRKHETTKIAWNYIKPGKWEMARHVTGDPIFDELFEIRVEQGRESEELLDADTRATLLSLRQDPYFDNMLLFVSPFQPDCLMVLTPPLPSDTTPTIDVIEALARGLCQ